MTHVYLPIITALLTAITTLLGVCAWIFWGILDELRKEVAIHTAEIAAEKTWRADHKDEVIVQRQHFADVAGRVERRVQDLEMTVRRFHGNGPVLP